MTNKTLPIWVNYPYLSENLGEFAFLSAFGSFAAEGTQKSGSNNFRIGS
jgi:hypothetical protein